ncbi:GMP reductase [Streptomyces laurentii]|uniref:GMP reductase n=1 Tax=Streptomyces laurentii TaxID=39478 RepID=A0A169ND27_STRLU|nr:GMP reductase [Streptomyces laurentii]
MPPRKRAAASVPRIPHADSCADPSRIERFPVLDSDGADRTVTRCLACGAQTVK